MISFSARGLVEKGCFRLDVEWFGQLIRREGQPEHALAGGYTGGADALGLDRVWFGSVPQEIPLMIAPDFCTPGSLIGGCPLLVWIHHFWREHPPNNGTGLINPGPALI